MPVNLPFSKVRVVSFLFLMMKTRIVLGGVLEMSCSINQQAMMNYRSFFFDGLMFFGRVCHVHGNHLSGQYLSFDYYE